MVAAMLITVPVVGVAVPSLLSFVVVFDCTLREAVRISAVMVAVHVTVGLVAFASLRTYLRPIGALGKDPAADPLAAWDAALVAPRHAARRLGMVVVPAQHLVLVPFIGAEVGLSRGEMVVIHLSTVLLEIASVLLIGIGTRFLFRPVVDETTPLLPAGATPSRSDWSLRGRLAIGIWVVCQLTGTVAAFATIRADSRLEVMVIGTVASLGFGTYVTWLILAGLVRPSLQPISDLIDATRRVRSGDVSERVPLTSPDELGELVQSFNDMQQGLAEREALHAAFGSYVDPHLARRLIESGSSIFEGEDLVVTVLFADVRDFTSYSESVSPAEAVQLLNRLFDVLVPVLHEHGGHTNHYLGDGLLALFGAPSPLMGHADAALAAAVEIQRRVRATFGFDLRLGIGINTGPVIAGTVGGGGRHEFTVIGDTVNTAARVEQLTKETGDDILFTEATRAALSSPRPRSTRRGEFEVRGKATRLTVYAVNPFPRSTR
jgi:adenylate cyclase